MSADTVLVFDGLCGFCTRSIGWIDRVDRRNRIVMLPYQAPGVLDRYGLTAQDCAGAAWTFTPDGTRHRGAAAINAALGTALGVDLPLWVYRLPLVGRLQDWVYAAVARNRRRLRGVTPWCVSHPEARCGPD